MFQHDPVAFADATLKALKSSAEEQSVSFNTEDMTADYQNELLDEIIAGLPVLGLRLKGIRTNAGNFHKIRADGDPARGGKRNDIPVATGGSVGFDTLELVIQKV